MDVAGQASPGPKSSNCEDGGEGGALRDGRCRRQRRINRVIFIRMPTSTTRAAISSSRVCFGAVGTVTATGPVDGVTGAGLADCCRPPPGTLSCGFAGKMVDCGRFGSGSGSAVTGGSGGGNDFSVGGGVAGGAVATAGTAGGAANGFGAGRAGCSSTGFGETAGLAAGAVLVVPVRRLSNWRPRSSPERERKALCMLASCPDGNPE